MELTGESHGMSPPGPGSQLVGKDTELIRSFGSRKKSLETPSLAPCVRAGHAFHPEIPTSSPITGNPPLHDRYKPKRKLRTNARDPLDVHSNR